jgi:glycosyltransferase involved in cell wall biosynthesis
MRLAVVTPVFNDWVSVSKLIGVLDVTDVPGDVEFSLFIVDDASSEPAMVYCPLQSLRRIKELHVIGLASNLGHQRAIAVGLVEVSRRNDFDAVVVMDSDGEDHPSDISRMLARAEQVPQYVICARRRRRLGLVVFRIWYGCYKAAFRLLTGTWIDFGNFCLIPAERVKALVTNSSIWNNLPATLTPLAYPDCSYPDGSCPAI